MDLHATYPETPACACAECRKACQRPGWPTPDEARRLIEAGHAHELMLDWWEGDEPRISILAPAIRGYEGKTAPYVPRSSRACVFQADGLCQLHDTGLKPFECRCVDHASEHEHILDMHRAVALTWATDTARALVAEWQAQVGEREPSAEEVDAELWQAHLLFRLMGK